jgi:antitoxin ParD1/3/4
MPTIEKLSIALPTEMVSLVRQAVDAGEYSSQSEVIRDALRAWTYRRNRRAHEIARLRDLVDQAAADDAEGEDPFPILDAMERKYSELAKKSAGE